MARSFREEPASNGVAFDFVGLDVGRRDRAELARFKRALGAPQAVEYSWFRDARDGGPFGVVRVRDTPPRADIILVWASLMVSIAVAMSFRAFDAGVAASITVGLAGLVALRRYLIKRSIPKDFRARFRVVVGPARVVIERDGAEAATFPLSDVLEVRAVGLRLELVRASGAAEPVPFVLEPPDEHGELATRITDAVLRARTTGGYRGELLSDARDEAVKTASARGRATP